MNLHFLQGLTVVNDKRLFLFQSDGYDPVKAQGPYDVFDLLQGGGKEIQTLRPIVVEEGAENATGWIAREMGAWMDLLPSEGEIQVCTVGWGTLWETSYPKRAAPEFVSHRCDALVQASLRDPLGASWWLETLFEPGGAARYLAFSDLNDGWAPLIVGDHAWIETCRSMILKTYSDFEISSEELSSNRIDSIVFQH